MNLQSDNYFYSHIRDLPEKNNRRHGFQVVFEHVGKDKQVVLDVDQRLLAELRENIKERRI